MSAAGRPIFALSPVLGPMGAVDTAGIYGRRHAWEGFEPHFANGTCQIY